VDRLAQLTGQTPRPGATVVSNPRLQWLSLLGVWLFLVLTLSRPVWLGEPLERIIPARDLLVAVDLSGSMETEDFTAATGERLGRLAAVKQVLDAFLAAREGDRLGLIVFGDRAFVQAPFTDDLAVIRLFLDEIQPRMAGPKTALGDAIGLAMTLFDRSELEDRVLLLFTDGNDTGSLVPPARAAGMARERGVVIHAIGVGDPGAVGEDPLDEALLRRITGSTGGKYFQAADRETLAAVTDAVDALTPREVQTLTHQPRRDLFHWPLGAALLLSLPYPLLTLLRARGREAPGPSTEEQPA
jgi:Ca-activated chloride channel family protein